MKTACSSYKIEGTQNHCPLLSRLRSPWFLVTREERLVTCGVGQSKIMDGSELAHADALVQACRLTPRVVHGMWEESVF